MEDNQLVDCFQLKSITNISVFQKPKPKHPSVFGPLAFTPYHIPWQRRLENRERYRLRREKFRRYQEILDNLDQEMAKTKKKTGVGSAGMANPQTPASKSPRTPKTTTRVVGDEEFEEAEGWSVDPEDVDNDIHNGKSPKKTQEELRAEALKSFKGSGIYPITNENYVEKFTIGDEMFAQYLKDKQDWVKPDGIVIPPIETSTKTHDFARWEARIQNRKPTPVIQHHLNLPKPHEAPDCDTHPQYMLWYKEKFYEQNLYLDKVGASQLVRAKEEMIKSSLPLGNLHRLVTKRPHMVYLFHYYEQMKREIDAEQDRRVLRIYLKAQAQAAKDANQHPVEASTDSDAAAKLAAMQSQIEALQAANVQSNKELEALRQTQVAPLDAKQLTELLMGYTDKLVKSLKESQPEPTLAVDQWVAEAMKNVPVFNGRDESHSDDDAVAEWFKKLENAFTALEAHDLKVNHSDAAKISIASYRMR